MKYFISLIISMWCMVIHAQEHVKVNGTSAELYTNTTRAPTILYVPGCNGLDFIGKEYQLFHRNKFKEIWPNANFVISQYVNDYTNGSVDGRCHWSGDDNRLKGRQSWDQALHTIELAKWIKLQPWSNGQVHLFGFSWGGRVGIWIPGDRHGTAGIFESVALIWPDCHKIQAGVLHTPTRIWATEEDPLSIPKNCPNYFKSPTDKLTLSLFPGNSHDWFSGPFGQPYTRWWPVQRVIVNHGYNENWTNQTFKDWKEWVDQL
jgi:dienelactone hydrolase